MQFTPSFTPIPGLPGSDVLGAWDQLTQAITNYKVLGLMGLLALVIGVIVAVLKRWETHGPGVPNWWARLPRWGRRTVVAAFGALAGALAAIQGGANPGQAIVIGFAGVLSVAGHELGRKLGLIPPSGSDGDASSGDGPSPPPAPTTPES